LLRRLYPPLAEKLELNWSSCQQEGWFLAEIENSLLRDLMKMPAGVKRNLPGSI